MIDPGAKEEFLRFLAQQRIDYVQALPSRLAELQGLWAAVAGGSQAPGDFERLVRAAHNLAGSGKVFGFEEFGTSAKALELQLQALAGSTGSPQGDAAAAVNESIARLQSRIPQSA